MDKADRKKALAEIEAQFLARDSALCWGISRELADFTVAFITATDGKLAPAGTGTLVSFSDSHYFLTARHVWEGKGDQKSGLKNCDWIRIPLKENSPCRFAISPNEIVPYGPTPPAIWNEWGPDITLLRIPPERVASFTAVGRPFFPLSRKWERQIDYVLETTFLMGAPALRGSFNIESAIPELQGMNVILGTGWYSSTVLSSDTRLQFDFVDMLIDTRQPDVAPSFEGVSGGGLWAVYVYPGAGDEIHNFKILRGVAFWQECVGDSALRVRCHGPQSIGAVLPQLYD
jgi:hypothetical protein